MSDSVNRPVYILGAGFSKAINDQMPTLWDLGGAIGESGVVSHMQLSENFTLEQWLSLHTQDLPFFKDYENMMRQAEARHAIEQIARLLDGTVNEIVHEPCPMWLMQLVSIWAAEQAVIITFNYDTLLEAAVNSVRPYASINVNTGGIRCCTADEVVYPRPIACTNTNLRWGETQTNAPCLSSMQILKPHGSLNWYTYGDGGDSSIIRVREMRRYAESAYASVIEAEEEELAEVRGMDRYLIPPSSNKASFYSAGLDRAIWNQCLEALRNTDEVAIVGYSVPETDYIVHELLNVACVRDDCNFHIVDPNAEKVVENIKTGTFRGKDLSYSLFTDVPTFVGRKMETRIDYCTGMLESVLEELREDCALYAFLGTTHSGNRSINENISERSVVCIDMSTDGSLTLGHPTTQIYGEKSKAGLGGRKKASKADLLKNVSDKGYCEIRNRHRHRWIAIDVDSYRDEAAVLVCIPQEKEI